MIGIEVKSPANRDLFFPPTQERLRGHVNPFALKQVIDRDALMERFGRDGIPGMVVWLDAEAGKGVIRDPLSTRKAMKPDEAAAVLGIDDPDLTTHFVDQNAEPETFPAGNAVGNYLAGRFGSIDERGRPTGVFGPVPRKEYALTPAEVETWGYWMKRAVQGGSARLIKGTFKDSYPLARKSFHHTPAADPKDGRIDQLTTLAQTLLEELKAERAKRK